MGHLILASYHDVRIYSKPNWNIKCLINLASYHNGESRRIITDRDSDRQENQENGNHISGYLCSGCRGKGMTADSLVTLAKGVLRKAKVCGVVKTQKSGLKSFCRRTCFLNHAFLFNVPNKTPNWSKLLQLERFLVYSWVWVHFYIKNVKFKNHHMPNFR